MVYIETCMTSEKYKLIMKFNFLTFHFVCILLIIKVIKTTKFFFFFFFFFFFPLLSENLPFKKTCDLSIKPSQNLKFIA